MAVAACSTTRTTELPDRSEAAVTRSSIEVEVAPEDHELTERFTIYSREGATRVETFFDAPFPRPVRVRVFPSRAALDDHFREAWGMDQPSECWMVGGAEEEALVLLSPRVWREEACDHDPDDDAHIRDLVAHELVHVYHMQWSPSHEFDGVEGLDWFVEGLATYVSSQYERFHVARAREALASGSAPKRLADAWTGPYRYGVSSSLVAYVASRIGRAGMMRLLSATNLEEVLAEVGMGEDELLAAWMAWVGAESSAVGARGSQGHGRTKSAALTTTQIQE
jgi:hypothetical protein